MANHTNWLNISSMSGSSGQTILTLSANTNYVTDDKVAIVKAYNPVYNISATTTVRISAYTPYISLSPTLIGVPASGGTYELNISANCSYVIAFPDMVSSYSTSAGTGDTTITFTVSGTSADTTLVGNIVVTDASGQLSRTARIEQYGAGVQIGVYPVQLYFDSTGGSKTFSVTSNAAYNVSPSTGTPWAFVEPHSGYTGETTFTVTVNEEYTGTTTREGVINIDAPGQDLAVIIYQRPPETRVVATYYVTSTTDPTRILYHTSSFSKAEYPDGTEITLGTGYTFPSTGFQTVYYTLTGDAIDQQTFRGCALLSSIVIPKGVTTLGQEAFSNCSILTGITLPNTLTTIGPACFNNGNFTGITLPNSLSGIGNQAFRNCAFSSITIPSAVTSIGSNCFSGSSVSSITFTSLTPPTLGATNALTSSSLTEIIVPCPAVNDYITAWPQYAQYISCNDTGTTLYFVTDKSNVKGVGEVRTITILNNNINPNRTGLNLPSSFPQQGSYIVVGNVIYLTYPANPSSSSTRSWTIGVVAQTNDGVSLSGSYNITQNANVTYSIPYTADTSTVSKTGETRTITIDASNLVASSITIGIEGATGITYTYNNGVITVVFPENTGLDRDIKINITGETLNGNSASATVTYRQESGFVAKYIITYDVQQTEYNTQICNNTSSFLSIEYPEGTVINKSTGFTFPSTGYQTVYFTTNNPKLSASAFSACSRIVSAIIPEGITEIGNCAFEPYAGSGATMLSSVTLPTTLERIEYNAFYGCKSLTGVTIPAGVLDSHCFQYCSGLTSVVLGDGVTELGIDAFSSCYSLSGIVIPANVTKLGSNCFSYTSLESITFNGLIPPTINSANSLGITALTFPIYVPCQSIDAYKTAFGTDYAPRIQCGDFATALTLDVTSNIVNYGLATVTVSPSTAFTSISFTTSDSSIATISNDGLITVLQDGTVTICAKDLRSNLEDCKEVYVRRGTCDTRLIEVLNVTSTTSPTEIYFDSYGTGMTTAFTNVEYNGNSISNDLRPMYNVNNVITHRGYVFPTTGLQTVYLTLKNPLILGDNSLRSNKTLVEVIIPEGVRTIDNGCLMENANLTSVTIPNTVTTLGVKRAGKIKTSNIFANCASLSSITLPDSITSTIPVGCFSNCISLTGITIPSGVTGLEDGCFTGCEALSGFSGKFATNSGAELIDGTTLIAFAPYGKTSYSIPSGVTRVGSQCFFHCNNLSSITIPQTVSAIGAQNFWGLSSLAEIHCYPSVEPTLELKLSWEDPNLHPDLPTSAGTIYAPVYSVGENGIIYHPTGSDYSIWLSNTISGVGHCFGYYGWTGQTF